jgi:glycosyltransferase involved in cell wall biosynthesis
VRHTRGDAVRVAQLIECDGPGGAEQVVAELSRALQAGGADTVAFLPEHGEGWLERQLAGSGVAIDRFRIDRPVAPASVLALARAFRRHRIAIAHSHEFSMAVYGACAAKLAGIPHVVTMHGGRYYAGRRRRRWAMRAAAAMSARLVAVSESVATALASDLGLPPHRILTIPNGVRPAASATPGLRQELGLGRDARIILAVGNLYPVKGHEHLIDALTILAPRYPDLHIAIAGRGALEPYLRARAADRGLTTRVHLLGLRGDVPALIAAADVFVQPSISEGLPLALLEAMFAGRPIVASEVGEVGIALAHGEAGLLVPPADAPALAAAIHSVLGDPSRARALGDAAVRRARAEYGFDRMVRRYVDLYRQLLPARDSAVPSTWRADSTGAPLS